MLTSTILVVELFAASSGYSESAEYDYPELLVTPRASDRLKMEAESESDSRFTRHIPIQAASFLTLTAGILALNDDRLPTQGPDDTPMAKWAGLGAIASGAGWLALTGVLSSSYSPYTTGWNSVKGMKSSTKRQQLEKERLAEESLAAPASLGRKLKWLSIFTNFSMSAFVMSATEDNATRVTALLGGLAAFTPLIFGSKWEAVDCLHRDYKKKIYGPLTSATLLWDKKSRRMLPAVSLEWKI